MVCMILRLGVLVEGEVEGLRCHFWAVFLAADDSPEADVVAASSCSVSICSILGEIDHAWGMSFLCAHLPSFK